MPDEPRSPLQDDNEPTGEPETPSTPPPDSTPPRPLKNPFTDFVNDHLDFTDMGTQDATKPKPLNPFQLTGRPQPPARSDKDVWNVDDDEDDDDDLFDEDDAGQSPTVAPPGGGIFGSLSKPSAPSGSGLPPRPGGFPPPGSIPAFGGFPAGRPPAGSGGLPRLPLPTIFDARWRQVRFRVQADLEVFHPPSPVSLPRTTVFIDANHTLKGMLHVIHPFAPDWMAVRITLKGRTVIGLARTNMLTLLPPLPSADPLRQFFQPRGKDQPSVAFMIFSILFFLFMMWGLFVGIQNLLSPPFSPSQEAWSGLVEQVDALQGQVEALEDDFRPQ